MAGDVFVQIDDNMAVAQAAQDKAVSYIEQANAAAGATPGYTIVHDVVAPTVTPPPYEPNAILPTEFQYDFNTVWSDLNDWINTGALKLWLDDNFPPLDPAVIAGEDAWLLDVITNGYVGVPASVDQMMWDRARSKDTIEALRLEDEAASAFAARGFSLPLGALTNRTLAVQRDAANKSSTIARDQAIKQIDIAVDMIKLAIGETTKLRLGMAAALADYIRTWMEMPKTAANVAKIKSDFYNTLWGAAANYGNMQVNVAQLALDASKANQSTGVATSQISVDREYKFRSLDVDAAMGSATAMAGIAGAARGANNTLVGAIETATSTV